MTVTPLLTCGLLHISSSPKQGRESEKTPRRDILPPAYAGGSAMLQVCNFLPKSLAELFGAEGADTVQTEAEGEAVFVADADVEGVIL